MKEESIGRLIAILYGLGVNHNGKQFEQYGLGGGQFIFLAALFAEDGISQETLASSIFRDKATVARAIQRLEQLGYIERRRSLEDGRVKLIHLTDKALEFKPTLFSILSSWTTILTQGLTNEEIRVLTTLLRRLVDNAVENKLSYREELKNAPKTEKVPV